MGSSKIKLDFLDPPTRDGDLGTLGHYRVIAQLGKGGMGYVFRAEDIKLERSVALKVMNRKIAPNQPDLIGECTSFFRIIEGHSFCQLNCNTLGCGT